jgi:hypothetical protein
MAYSIDRSTKIVRVVYTGTLTNKDILGVLNDSLVVFGKESSPPNRIEDMRDVNAISIGFSELLNLADEVKKLQLPHVVKSAILTGNSVQYGVARIFQTLLDHPRSKIGVFSSEEDANNWLSATDKDD